MSKHAYVVSRPLGEWLRVVLYCKRTGRQDAAALLLLKLADAMQKGESRPVSLYFSRAEYHQLGG
jgi:hypothetical protein